MSKNPWDFDQPDDPQPESRPRRRYDDRPSQGANIGTIAVGVCLGLVLFCVILFWVGSMLDAMRSAR